MDLYTPVHPRLCRYVQSMVWNEDEAKDLVGEITLQAFESFESIKNKDQFVFFVFGIARNLFLKKIRRKKFVATWDEEAMTQLHGNNHADERLKQKELAFLLNQLPTIQREAITLYEIAGFSYEEIASMQHLPLSTVKANLYKGRQALKKYVEKEVERIQQMRLAQSESNLKMDGLL